jgi:hypothetical protein
MVKRERTRWVKATIAAAGCTGALAAMLTVMTMATTARGDDRATTASTIDALEHDTAHKDAIAATLKRAKDAVERATRLRAAGDEGHARLADGLAWEEASAAQDLVRAIDAEKGANDARRSATDAGVMGDRERALLEEGITRNGRLKAEIEETTKPKAETKTARTDPKATPAAAPALPPKAADAGAR